FEHFRTTPGGVLRDGRWKLVEFFHPDSSASPQLELYDLESDPHERTDLSGSNPEKAAAMYADLARWRRAVKAPVPTEREPGFIGTRNDP
ncbi:MAG: hypothetical protein ACPGPE_14730, partial [Planctomycetota bacterium]